MVCTSIPLRPLVDVLRGARRVTSPRALQGTFDFVGT